MPSDLPIEPEGYSLLGLGVPAVCVEALVEHQHRESVLARLVAGRRESVAPATTQVLELTTANLACHSLDADGRPICGAETTGLRAPHTIGVCWNDRHKRCGACDSLMDIDGDDPALLEGA